MAPDRPVSAHDAKLISQRVAKHRQGVADKILANIYSAIRTRAQAGEKVLVYVLPVFTDTVYDREAVGGLVRASLLLRNYRVAVSGQSVYISWL